MEQRYATNPDQVHAMDTQELRSRFLVTDLFADDTVNACYSHHDRVILLGAQPVSGPVRLPGYEELRSEYFLEHREAGVINVGGTGTVDADGTTYEMANGACLYLGRGVRDVSFASSGGAAAKFYLFSAPAHTTYPTTLVAPGEGNRLELGDRLTSNQRVINQYIHQSGVQSCQVVMGVTTLLPGSMWNTMPAHTHDRRMEAYLYFELPEDARVLHLMGQPDETRHLLVANEQAVISPSWSVHSGVGTASYSFVWAMAGENQAFEDMDLVPVTAMS